MILLVQKLIKVGVAACIYTWPGGNQFVLESSASFQWIKNETKPLPCLCFKLHSMHAVVNYVTTVETDSPLIQQSS